MRKRPDRSIKEEEDAPQLARRERSFILQNHVDLVVDILRKPRHFLFSLSKTQDP